MLPVGTAGGEEQEQALAHHQGATWAGFLYLALVLDAFRRWIDVGRRRHAFRRIGVYAIFPLPPGIARRRILTQMYRTLRG